MVPPRKAHGPVRHCVHLVDEGRPVAEPGRSIYNRWKKADSHSRFSWTIYQASGENIGSWDGAAV
eukprot:scaffold3931_cov112-Isochrysis_galbana.AAC.3